MQVWWQLYVVVLVATAVADDNVYSTVPILPVLLASSSSIPEPACKVHSHVFLQHLSNNSLWAVQMLDSSAKVPEGVVAGNIYHLGQFDECLDVKFEDLRGKYCLVEVSLHVTSYQPTSTTDPFSLHYDPRVHVWEKIKDTEDRTKIRRTSQHMGLCIPSSCSAEGLEVTLNHELRLLGEKTGLSFQAHVSPELCTTWQHSQPLSAGEIAYSVVAGTLVLLVILGTSYVYINGEILKPSVFQRLVLSFAVQVNVKKLTNVVNGNPALNVNDGFKLFLAAGCIAGHRLALSYFMYVQDASEYEALFRGAYKASLIGGTLVVDFFFVMSGTVLAYLLLSHMRKHKSSSIFMIALARIVRLTPVYMMVVFFYATWFYRTGSGPLWETTVGLERERCRNNWWTNLLYINNYVNTDNMCMFQSWYLTCDTQMFLFSIPIIYWIKRWPCWGYFVLTALTVLAVLVPFFNTWLRGLDALLIAYQENMVDLPSSYYFREFYVKTENRVIPYLIGIMAGIVLEKYRFSKFRLNKLQSLVCFTLLVGTLLASELSSYRFYEPGSTYTSVEAGIYAALSRLFFAMSSGGFSLLVAFGSIGVLEGLMGWKPLRILSKLSYGAYLVHTLSILYNKGSLRTSFPSGPYSLLWLLMGDMVFSFSLSLLLMLLVEYPARCVESILFSRHRQHQEERQGSPASV